MLYSLRIGDEIFLKDENDDRTFTKFIYKSNSLNNDIREKNVSARNEFTFKGDITDNNYVMLKKIAEWAISTSNVYRDIEIIVIDDANNAKVELRHFNFDEVFCIDYSETYGGTSGSENGDTSPRTFELSMAQKKLGTRKEITCTSNDDDE